MAQPTITDGSTTITFGLFTNIDHSMQSQKFFAQALQKGRGQRIRAPGMFFEAYKFTFLFKSASGGDSGWEQYEIFVDFTKARHKKYEYQRKLTFVKPGTTSTNKVIQGQVTNVATNVAYGTDEAKVIGSFDFVMDNISKQVP